jgi:hypothetical protein
MSKGMFFSGAALVAAGAMAFFFFVLPRVGGAGSGSVLPDGRVADGPSLLAVVIATFGLAAGSALVGIGLGRWKRPRPSPHDGSPEA